jgi:hypothetical protein
VLALITRTELGIIVRFGVLLAGQQVSSALPEMGRMGSSPGIPHSRLSLDAETTSMPCPGSAGFGITWRAIWLRKDR